MRLLMISITTLSSLVAFSQSVPFSGEGNLIALKNGQPVGCLTSTASITVNLNACAAFTSTLSPSRTTTQSIQLSSSAGTCGQTYVGYDPKPGGVENVKYKIGCGPGEYGDWIDLWASPGRYSNSAYTILMVGFHRNFTTRDFVRRDPSLPSRNQTFKVFTDESLDRPEDFQLGWKAVCKGCLPS